MAQSLLDRIHELSDSLFGDINARDNHQRDAFDVGNAIENVARLVFDENNVVEQLDSYVDLVDALRALSIDDTLTLDTFYWRVVATIHYQLAR
jgi:hypothetical protein